MSKNLLIAIILLSIISGIIIAGCGSGGTGQITVPPTVTSTTVPELVNIKGQALEVNGIPIPNAFVVCVNPGLSASLFALADTMGNYLFKNLPPGNYRIEIWRSEGDHNSSPGSPIGAVNITVTEGTITVNVTAGTIDPTATPTVTPAVTNTPTATNTPGCPTNTPKATNTPGGSTNTPTATNTPGGPTNTPTNTPTPSWKYVGNAGFSAGTVFNSSLDVYDGTPYVAYRDEGNGNRATVMTYNGTGWTNAGTAGFSAGSASDTSLYVYNGIPYVAYMDGAKDGKATVMRFDGTDWTNVGNAGFSASMAGYISLKVYNGKPYVAYSDLITEWIGGEEYEWAYVRVMTYNGINWMHVGTEGFSGGAGRFPSLYVYNGTPYVAYVDLSVENPLDVMMYNGTSWGAVGSFSEGKGTFPFLYLSNGTPYVVYTDMAHDYKASVMKFSN